MDTITELRQQIKALEELLAEEKKFRDTMNGFLRWEKERHQLECDALKKTLSAYRSKARENANELDFLRNLVSKKS